MPGERRAIENPLWIDFSTMPTPPLRFVLQQEHRSAGLVERPAPGVTLAHTPWYTEMALELSGVDAVGVLYRLPVDERTHLLAACLDRTFEPLFRLMSGADFGDPVTALVAQHWPDIHAMLRRSADGVTDQRLLCNIATAGSVQWAVADPLSADEDGVSAQAALGLLAGAAQTFLRTSQFATELPGIVHALGGPDRASRRLTAAGGLLKSMASLGEGFADGVQEDELVGMAEAVHDLVLNAKQLRD